MLRAAEETARRGSTPLAVAEGNRVLGVVELKDIVKTGIKERFAELRRMGIKTVMITGDNKLTAAAIAAEAGVDDFLAEATPEDKLALIRQYQAEGRLVAMTGDGTNDAPALAQADVAVAMGSGTQAAKEAGNMVDLDSNPTKLLEVVETGKALLMTRGSLTTFSIANDVAKYFAIIPAIFVSTYPQLGALNVMRLASPSSAILSGGDLQRAGHRVPDSAGAQGRALPARGRRRAAAPQPGHLRPGRPARALHRHQADRLAARRSPPGLRSSRHEQQHATSFVPRSCSSCC
jgi:K+-transporting ATPase ATPase B chain